MWRRVEVACNSRVQKGERVREPTINSRNESFCCVRWQNSRAWSRSFYIFSNSPNWIYHAMPSKYMKHLSSFIIRTHQLFIKIVQHTKMTKEVLITWQQAKAVGNCGQHKHVRWKTTTQRDKTTKFMYGKQEMKLVLVLMSNFYVTIADATKMRVRRRERPEKKEIKTRKKKTTNAAETEKRRQMMLRLWGGDKNDP